MLEFIVVLILAQGAIFGLFCSFIAAQKNRNSFGWFIIGFFFSFLAVLALIAIPRKRAKNSQLMKSPGDSITNLTKLDQGLFFGDRKLSSSKYQLFLVKKYGIEKNATLEKYVIEGDVFGSLDDAIVHADALYESHFQKYLNKDRELSELSSSIKAESGVVLKRIIHISIVIVLIFVALYLK